MTKLVSLVCTVAALVAPAALALTKQTTIGTTSTTFYVDPGGTIACAAPPPAPTYVSAGAQGGTTLGLSFSDSGDCETRYEIQHRNADAGGSWVSRATLPALSGGSTSYTDLGLLEDTYYCYRVVARNDYGATSSTSQLCMKTRQLTANRKDLHDVRLRVKVAPFADAGTDAPVLARLNARPNSGWYPIGNETWLDFGRDDFRTGDNWTFILNETSLPKSGGAPILSDVSQIVLDVQGSDVLCVSELELLVNGAPAYRGSYGTTSTTARCGSQGKPISVSKAELRASPLWQSFSSTSPPVDLSEEGVVASIEASMGHRLHGSGAYWDDEPAPSAPGDLWVGMQAHPDTAEGFVLNLPLRVSVDNWFDPQVLVQMVMEIESTCVDNRTTVRIYSSNIYADVGFDWWADIVHTLATAGLYFLAEPALDGYAEGEVEPTEMEFSVPVDGCFVVSYDEGYGFSIAGAS